MEKIKESIKKNIKLILILFFILIVLVLIIVQATKRFADTTSYYNKVSDDQMKEGVETDIFYVVGVSPKESEIETWDMSFSFVITFSEPINEESIKIEISPNIKFNIIKDSKNESYLWVTPQGRWANNTDYEMVVKEGASITGNTLKTLYTHKFHVRQIFPKVD